MVYGDKMNEKNNKNILIACYRSPYNKESIDKIEKLIQNKKPDKIIVLSISETKKSSVTIESYLGKKDVNKLKGQYEKDQEIRTSGYSDKILKLSKKFDIPAEKIIKKGKASRIIIKAVEKYKPSHVIIHPSDKSSVDKIFSGSVEDRVCKDSSCEVTILK